MQSRITAVEVRHKDKDLYECIELGTFTLPERILGKEGLDNLCKAIFPDMSASQYTYVRNAAKTNVVIAFSGNHTVCGYLYIEKE